MNEKYLCLWKTDTCEIQLLEYIYDDIKLKKKPFDLQSFFLNQRFKGWLKLFQSRKG